MSSAICDRLGNTNGSFKPALLAAMVAIGQNCCALVITWLNCSFESPYLSETKLPGSSAVALLKPSVLRIDVVPDSICLTARLDTTGLEAITTLSPTTVQVGMICTIASGMIAHVWTVLSPWTCELIYTETGYAEQGCVFRTGESSTLGPGT